MVRFAVADGPIAATTTTTTNRLPKHRHPLHRTGDKAIAEDLRGDRTCACAGATSARIAPQKENPPPSL